MSLVDGVKQWIFTIALKKGVDKGVMALVALLASAKLAPLLQQFGISIDSNTLTIALTGLIMAKLEMLRNYLKTKYNLKVL